MPRIDKKKSNLPITLPTFALKWIAYWYNFVPIMTLKTVAPPQITQEDIEFDRAHLWHPYTSLTDPLPVYPVVAASGVHLELADGRRLIDGMSSWWAAIHGYNHPRLNAAAHRQLEAMSHVMFGGITHPAAIELGRLLVACTPDGLDRVFLCDSGSVSVEVALKMAIQYQHALGKPHKTQFLTFAKGYHGDTTGAMSVCDPVSGMHQLFSGFLPQHHFVAEPELGYDRPMTVADHQALRLFFEAHAEQAAAFILEPIVQGAGGMRIYAPAYLQAIRQLCDEHGLLLIADEIATGFGRTGKLFAVEHAGILPDILCLGKALTGGYLTLAASLCTAAVADTIGRSAAGVLMHGPTFMANPLACAIAAESIRLLLEQPWAERVAAIEATLAAELGLARGHVRVQDVRVLGAIGVIETRTAVRVAPTQAFLVEQGVWVRPFRKLLYIMPPYTMTEAELVQLCTALRAVLEVEECFE